MRKAIIASTFIVAGYVLGIASCGGATTTVGTDGGGGTTGSGSKGSAGSGAKGSGGSKGSGGAAGTGAKGSAGAAGTGGTAGAGGGKGSGGSAGTTGGTGGSTGTGGGDGGPGPGCGPTEPMNGSACTASTTGFTQCIYGSDVCDCFGGMGMGDTWNCTTCPMCPATQPTGTCMGGGRACGALPPCTYGTTSCSCAGGFMGGGSTWTCGTCPGTAPADMSMCTTDGLTCNYGSTSCDCRGFMGGGTAWRCFTPPPACPMTEPTPGSTCVDGTGGFMGCTYGTASCQCVPVGMSSQWSCT